MKTIILKNGYVRYPDEWVAVKNMDPKKASNCGVLACRNSGKYDIPTFMFFLENKTIDEMDAEDESNVYEACKRVFPAFSEVLKSQVEPQYDKNHRIVNLEAWDDAPTIGWFHVFDVDDDQDLYTDALIYRD